MSAPMDALSVLRPWPELLQTAEGHAEEYRRGYPFPYVVLDNFLPEAAARELAETFPAPDDPNWLVADEKNRIRKRVMNNELAFPASFRNLLYALHSATFLRFLTALTGERGWIPDPHLWYAGLQQTERDCVLGVHADMNFHPEYRLFRRLSLNLYLSPQWRPQYGGGLQLWDDKSGSAIVEIPALFNRCLIFFSDEKAYHGYPSPVKSPEAVYRNSLTLFYYLNLPQTKERRPLQWSQLWMPERRAKTPWWNPFRRPSPT